MLRSVERESLLFKILELASPARANISYCFDIKQIGLDCRIENDYCLCMSPANPPQPNTPATPQLRVSSETLLGPRKELVIVHNGREYRLRLTQNGKLILTA